MRGGTRSGSGFSFGLPGERSESRGGHDEAADLREPEMVPRDRRDRESDDRGAGEARLPWRSAARASAASNGPDENGDRGREREDERRESAFGAYVEERVRRVVRELDRMMPPAEADGKLVGESPEAAAGERLFENDVERAAPEDEPLVRRRVERARSEGGREPGREPALRHVPSLREERPDHGGEEKRGGDSEAEPPERHGPGADEAREEEGSGHREEEEPRARSGELKDGQSEDQDDEGGNPGEAWPFRLLEEKREGEDREKGGADAEGVRIRERPRVAQIGGPPLRAGGGGDCRLEHRRRKSERASRRGGREKPPPTDRVGGEAGEGVERRQKEEIAEEREDGAAAPVRRGHPEPVHVVRDDALVEEAPERLAPDDRRKGRDGGDEEEGEAPAENVPRKGRRLVAAAPDGERRAERRSGVEEEERQVASEEPCHAGEERCEQDEAEGRVVRPAKAEVRTDSGEDGAGRPRSRGQTRTSSWSGAYESAPAARARIASIAAEAAESVVRHGMSRSSAVRRIVTSS